MSEGTPRAGAEAPATTLARELSPRRGMCTRYPGTRGQARAFVADKLKAALSDAAQEGQRRQTAVELEVEYDGGMIPVATLEPMPVEPGQEAETTPVRGAPKKDVDKLIGELGHAFDRSQDDDIRKQAEYFERNKDAVSYGDYRDHGGSTASSEVDSAHRHVVQKRLKIPGAWWHPDNVRNILALRMLKANRWWDEYWELQRQQWRTRAQRLRNQRLPDNRNPDTEISTPINEGHNLIKTRGSNGFESHPVRRDGLLVDTLTPSDCQTSYELGSAGAVCVRRGRHRWSRSSLDVAVFGGGPVGAAASLLAPLLPALPGSSAVGGTTRSPI